MAIQDNDHGHGDLGHGAGGGGNPGPGGGHNEHPVTISVDNEQFTIPDRDTTPRALLALVHKTPETAYIVAVQGREQKSYKDRPDEPIRAHEHQTFITVPTLPTPVS